jgi:hypothetical protein
MEKFLTGVMRKTAEDKTIKSTSEWKSKKFREIYLLDLQLSVFLARKDLSV